MKYVKTFEAYVAYSDYERKGLKYGTPSQIEEDLRTTIINMLIKGGVSNTLDGVKFEDQSSDKGIKWQISVKGKGTDIIHAYKKTTFIGDYEFYLNNKKTSKYDIEQYFLDKYLTDLERYINAMNSYDSTHMYSDDSRSRKSGESQASQLKALYVKLSTADKKRATAEYESVFKIKVDPVSFKGAMWSTTWKTYIRSSYIKDI